MTKPFTRLLFFAILLTACTSAQPTATLPSETPTTAAPTRQTSEHFERLAWTLNTVPYQEYVRPTTTIREYSAHFESTGNIHQQDGIYLLDAWQAIPSGELLLVPLQLAYTTPNGEIVYLASEFILQNRSPITDLATFQADAAARFPQGAIVRITAAEYVTRAAFDFQACPDYAAKIGATPDFCTIPQQLNTLYPDYNRLLVNRFLTEIPAGWFAAGFTLQTIPQE